MCSCNYISGFYLICFCLCLILYNTHNIYVPGWIFFSSSSALDGVVLGRSWWTGEGLYEVRPCTSTSDTVCDACLNPPHFGNHPEEERSEAHEAQVAANTDYERQCGHRNNAPSQQRNLLSTLTIADNGKKRTTSGNLIHFLGPNAVAAASASDLTNSLAAAGNSSENAVPTGSFPSGSYSLIHHAPPLLPIYMMWFSLRA